MIIKRLYLLIFVVFLVSAYIISLSSVEAQRNKLNKTNSEVYYVLPAPLLKITTFEFHGLAADYLFLKVLTFYGGTMERKERPRIKESEWRWMYDVSCTATDLDPYFIDPYYFANANFTWGPHMIKETNSLLDKGSRHRVWDWMLPFFMGFNEFYFLKNDTLASRYLMEGAKRPEAPSLLATLATRLAYKEERTKVAIAFLYETIGKTKDKNIRKDLECRLVSLEGVDVLESAVNNYKRKFGKLPKNLKELQYKGLIVKMPVDPYGGEYYLDTDGAIKTTSDLRMMRR